MNIIFDENGLKIQVTQICVFEEKVYVVLHLLSEGENGNSIQVNCSHKTSMRYYSAKSGVFEFAGIYPSSHDLKYNIPNGFFKEIQLVYFASSISEGDYFDVVARYTIDEEGLFFGYGCYECPVWRFTYTEGRWVVSSRKPDEGAFSMLCTLNFSNKEEDTENSTTINPFEHLNSLIGLSSVKDEVITLANFVRIQRMREEKGLKVTPISYHCVFTGNPGTGKTTVARIVASIYKELGILKNGHLIETDRSGLVANYVGQTATKTNEVIDSALDGVLFIDEAYALAQSESKNDFGAEAIATLLKRMEDNRNRLVVIIAGYSKEMKDFINSNSGLKSRFVRFINFPDYSAEDLTTIFCRFVEEGGYRLENNCALILQEAFNSIANTGDRNYGNGRYVRNVYEESIKAQANRLSLMTNISEEDLLQICAGDISNAVVKVNKTIE